MEADSIVAGELARIGANLRTARLTVGFTQEQAAHRAGMDYKRWQRLEAGEVNATVRTLIRAALAVEVDLPRLLAS